MEKILSLARKVAEEAEVFLLSSQETPVVFEANRLKQLQDRQSTMVALRLVREGRIGFSISTHLNERKALVDRAVEMSQFGPVAEFELPPKQVYPEVDVYDPEMEAFTIEEMAEVGESLIAKVLGHTPDLLCDARITKDVLSIRLLNSRGGEASYQKSISSIGLEGNLVKDTDMLFVSDSDSSCHPVKDGGKVAGAVIQQLESARSRASAPTQPVPVVFTPLGVVSALIAPLLIALNGKMVLQGASPLVNRKGEQVFNNRLSLWDNATIPHCPRSRPCDDEGVPSQCTTLVEKGTVMNFIYDLQTAALAHTQSTGNGDRANGGLPTPSPSALIIEKGDVAVEDMIRDMKEGLVIEQVMGAEQTNILGGEFGGNVLLGYKVEKGQIVGRVKDTMISGNIYQALADPIVLGKEARWVGGLIYTPSLYCPRLAVASKG